MVPATHRRLTLLAVIAAFALPIVLAWWFVEHPPRALTRELVNHGTLLEPVIDIHADPALAALEAVPLAPGDWAMLAVAAGACTARCEAVVEQLADIRTVLGQAATRVRVARLSDGSRQAAAERAGVVTLDDAAAHEALVRRLPSAMALPAIVLLDFRGRVVMVHAGDAPPDAIKADVKRLLRASKVR